MSVLHVHFVHSNSVPACFVILNKQNSEQRIFCSVQPIDISFCIDSLSNDCQRQHSSFLFPSVRCYWQCPLRHRRGARGSLVSRVILGTQPWNWQLLRLSSRVFPKRNFWVRRSLTAFCSPRHCHRIMHLEKSFHQWLVALVVLFGWRLPIAMPPGLANKSSLR